MTPCDCFKIYTFSVALSFKLTAAIAVSFSRISERYLCTIIKWNYSKEVALGLKGVSSSVKTSQTKAFDRTFLLTHLSKCLRDQVAIKRYVGGKSCQVSGTQSRTYNSLTEQYLNRVIIKIFTCTNCE